MTVPGGRVGPNDSVIVDGFKMIVGANQSGFSPAGLSPRSSGTWNFHATDPTAQLAISALETT